ncbi:MAG: hypothetical protein H8D67_22695 [Deltaproteobacteria bacterium]|nr:hypothetical protein [Deltaproteobacteria bacterium]
MAQNNEHPAEHFLSCPWVAAGATWSPDSGLTQENYQIIDHNLKENYKQAFEKTRDIADLITKCLTTLAK